MKAPRSPSLAPVRSVALTAALMLAGIVLPGSTSLAADTTAAPPMAVRPR